MRHRLLRYLILIVSEIALVFIPFLFIVLFDISLLLVTKLLIFSIIPILCIILNVIWTFKVSSSNRTVKTIAGIFSAFIVFIVWYIGIVNIDINKRSPFFFCTMVPLAQVFFWELMNKLKIVLIKKEV